MIGMPKDTAYRDRRVLDEAQHHNCKFCGNNDGSTVAAHSNQARHGKGLGRKAHDCFVAFLCHSCHAFVDGGQGTQDERNAVWQAAHVVTIPFIWPLMRPEGRMKLDRYDE